MDTAAYPRAGDQPKKRKLTFTEIITVVVLLFVLGAILMPVFASSGRSPYRSRCLSNVKQLTVASLIYASDNNDVMPFLADRINREHLNDATGITYEDLIQPFHKQGQEIYKCPEDFNAQESPVAGKSYFEAYGTSYHFRPIHSQLKSFGSAPEAAQTIFILEADVFHETKGVRRRYAGYYDGHAKYTREAEIFKK